MDVGQTMTLLLCMEAGLNHDNNNNNT